MAVSEWCESAAHMTICRNHTRPVTTPFEGSRGRLGKETRLKCHTSESVRKSEATSTGKPRGENEERVYGSLRNQSARRGMEWVRHVGA